jgi:hypothetical protein
MDRFSSRHRLEPQEPEITVTQDAPHELRGVAVDLAYASGLDPKSLRSIVCRTLRTRESDANWTHYPNIDGEVRGLVDRCHWYEVYDIIEAVHASLLGSASRASVRHDPRPQPTLFAGELNEYFRKRGIGWQLADGLVRVRGAEAFEQTVHAAEAGLRDAGRTTAANEIHQALLDLSRRPHPDVTGALQHGLAALECVMRDVCGDASASLGTLLARHKALIPAPLDQAVEKIWGFASEQGRHLREGREPSLEEAELAVHVALATATYLSRKKRPLTKG